MEINGTAIAKLAPAPRYEIIYERKTYLRALGRSTSGDESRGTLGERGEEKDSCPCQDSFLASQPLACWR
jgi:hypothetical protein